MMNDPVWFAQVWHFECETWQDLNQVPLTYQEARGVLKQSTFLKVLRIVHKNDKLF